MKRLATLALAGVLTAGTAAADLVIPDLHYRTGAYAAGGIPFSDGYQDYFNLLNQRDGGIGGEMVRIVSCETAYDTERGVECYESTKAEGSLVYQPLSTGITYQLIPRATADGIPLHTMGYGRTSAANGDVFSHVFNYPANYWDAASVIINQLLEENGGSLEGKSITLLYHNSAYGREPIRTLETLAAQHGFTLTQIAVDHPGQEQGNQWLQIRRERPDYVVMWGWGVMNQVAIQEAVNIRFPMENFIGNWWAGAEHDVAQAGAAAAGYRSLNMNRLGDMPVFDEIREYVHGRGLAAGDGSNVGSVLYTRGMYAAMLAAEAIRTAQEIHGVAAITPAMMRDGMEALVMTNARMEELGMPGIGPEFAVTCEDHGGTGMAIMQQWDGSQWVTLTDFVAPDDSVTQPLIDEDSAAFAAENNIASQCGDS
ncbi:ABC transporter substrate-binding protein [Roseicyclus persicicus]|uniref:ABC transporter substrate-binding protein n=1 Tax=Roseicyclus persicicus TaxID=2650661 RepID=A0A7X6GZI4_9RHOB|nr:ABC transporter substrate-binding protein [Roseibacterium persicicum]NKX45257.1 ABC transporter substrate-binding protein [Roseibacterium persicicum]